MKAISIILQCCGKRLELLNTEPEVNGLREYIDSIKKAENDMNRREKAIQAYLEGRKLTKMKLTLEQILMQYSISTAIDDSPYNFQYDN